MLIIHPSSVPLREACSASSASIEGEILINSAGVPAFIGRAVHKMNRVIVEEDLNSPPDPTPYAMEEGIEGKEDELRMLSWFFIQAWQGSNGEPGLKDRIEDVVCEERIEATIQATDPNTGEKVEVAFSGAMDVRGMLKDGSGPVVLDTKSGWKMEEKLYAGQMKAYSWLLMQLYPDAKKAAWIIIWLRDRTTTTVFISRKECDEWMDEFLMRSAFWDGQTYCPGEFGGEHCEWCPRMASCPGRLEKLRGGLAVFQEKAPSLLCYNEAGNLKPANILIDAWTQWEALKGAWKVIEKAGKGLEGELKQILFNGGEIAAEDIGLQLKEKKGRDKIDPLKAWPIMTKYLNDKEIAPAVTLKKSALADVIADKAERGEKKKAINLFLDELKEAEAITEGKPSYSLAITQGGRDET